MFPRLRNNAPSASTRSRSIHRTILSTPGYGRLPSLSGRSRWTTPTPKRSTTDPRWVEYQRHTGHHTPKRRVKSLVQNHPRRAAARQRHISAVSGRKSVVETTYVLSPGRVAWARGRKSAVSMGHNRPQTRVSSSDRENLNEGVVRKSQYVKDAPDDRIIRRRYEFDDMIGEGNFSVVVRCYDRKNGSCWALKAIDKANLNRKCYYIENEVDLLLRCVHPNIIRLKEAYQTPDQYFLIMELLENGDLFDAIRRMGSFDESICASVVCDVASALRYLHSHNIVHRDIKPENLLLTSDFRVKLGDFGLACRVRGPLYRVCGTPTYVAPEVLAETGYGLEVDCWALGVIMYILLCGFAPFRNQDRNELFRLIQTGRYQFEEPKWARVSKGAKGLVSSLLVVDPSERCLAQHILRNPWLGTMLSQMREV